jgi:Phage integrase family
MRRSRSQRGYIEELASGSFRAVVPAGLDPLTKRRRSLRETCKTMGEARVALTKLQRQVDQQQHPKSVSHRYRRLAIKLRLRSTRLHALRHYSATELLTAGVDLRTVAGRLGHGSGGATTLNTYAAWVEQADQWAAEKIAAIAPRGRSQSLSFPGERTTPSPRLCATTSSAAGSAPATNCPRSSNSPRSSLWPLGPLTVPSACSPRTA